MFHFLLVIKNLVDDVLDSSIKCPLCRSVTFISGGRAQVDLNIRTDYDFMALIDHVKLSTCQAKVPQALTVGPSAKAGVPIKELHSDQLEKATLILPSSTESTTDFSYGGKEKSLTAAKGKALKKPQFRKIKKNKKKRKKTATCRHSHSESSFTPSTSQSSDSSESDSSNRKSKKKFDRRRHYFTSPKSEMKTLMRKFNKTPVPPKASKEEKDDFFIKDLFLVATTDARELPPTLEYESLAAAGLWLRCDIQFHSNGSPKHVLRVFKSIKYGSPKKTMEFKYGHSRF
ncbi:Uncharacterized protein APZ42_033919 [Daphnia magna]|uniref:Uncharacterized protein n=1 Tax=Daphnia magna TaxID=35525 RepID=A0A164KLG4_9CRUS|nr:Uncharacterized protein APZ42_033919 [Daphnia magna]